MSEQEKKNEKIGIAVSVGLHAIILLLFFFILAWRAPDPPLPDYGIELNFGMDDAGSGTKQPLTPANESPKEETEPESRPIPEQEVVKQQPVAEAEPTVDRAVETPDDVVTQQEPSPVTREEVKEPEPKPEPAKETKKETPKPEPVAEAKKEEPKKETAKPALFPGEDSNAEASNANQGDREGAVGDQGNEQGSLDSRALYGEQGGGQGGPQLQISGWMWDDRPDKKDTSNENGQVVFDFTIDDKGYVVDIKTKQSTVSPRVTQFYKEQLLRTTFSPTNSGANRAQTTTGTVTFIIKSR